MMGDIDYRYRGVCMYREEGGWGGINRTVRGKEAR